MIPLLKAGKLNNIGLPGIALLPVAADLQNEEDPAPKMILGNHKWATLVWPLKTVMVNRTTRYQLDHDGEAELVFLHDLDQWEALPLIPVWCDQAGVCFQRSQVKEPLVKAVLRRSSELVFADLNNLAAFFHVDLKKSRSALLATLASLFGDESYVNSVLQNDGSKGGHGQSQEDADFLACIFSELDKNEQEEFKMVKKQIDSQRTKQKTRLVDIGSQTSSRRQRASDNCLMSFLILGALWSHT